MGTKHSERFRMAPGFRCATESQKVFRSILEVVSRPGRILAAGATIAPPEPMDPAFGAVCLTLLDFETPFWTDLPEKCPALAWLRFHCGAPRTVEPREAGFVLITRPSSLCPLDRFHPGEEDRPERGATVVAQVAGMGHEGGRRLTGPGIEASASLRVDGLPPSFWAERAAMHRGFPLGLDILFTARHALAALPRSTRNGV